MASKFNIEQPRNKPRVIDIKPNTTPSTTYTVQPVARPRRSSCFRCSCSLPCAGRFCISCLCLSFFALFLGFAIAWGMAISNASPMMCPSGHSHFHLNTNDPILPGCVLPYTASWKTAFDYPLDDGTNFGDCYRALANANGNSIPPAACKEFVNRKICFNKIVWDNGDVMECTGNAKCSTDDDTCTSNGITIADDCDSVVQVLSLNNDGILVACVDPSF